MTAGSAVSTRPPASGPEGPLKLTIVEHERLLPYAAFTDRQGRLSEATIWNLAFWDGDTVVWPDAGLLRGTTRDILPDLAGAVVMNSWTPGIAVRRIGETPLPEAPSFVASLHRSYETEPFTRP